MRRRLFQDGAIVRASRVNPALALSVEDLIKTLHRIRNKAADSGILQKIYPTVTFKIDEWPDPNVVCLKHQVADDNKCKGRVVDGACNRCYCVVPGVLAYSFQVHIEDNTQPLATLTAWVSDKGGAALFGMPADQFNALTARQQGDAQEDVTDVSIAAKMIVTCEPGGDDVFVCIFDAMRV